MYSVVLMVALTGGAETPAMGWGCKGCDCSCSSYSCSGCSSYSCHGCKGCFGSWGCSKCHGCSSCSKCHGCSSCKCSGGWFSKRCHGCHGCHGCCSYSCHGCCGGYSCTGCTGCTGSYGCCGGTVVVPEGKTIEKVKEPKVIEKKKGEAAAPAKIIVSLPADARLTIDGAATTSVSDRRIFQSPELAPGKNFSYTLKAEFNQDGKPVVVTKEVTIQAGAEVNVTLAAPAGVVSR